MGIELRGSGTKIENHSREVENILRQPIVVNNYLQSTIGPVANSAMMSTLTANCQWEDEMVWERTGHPPSYAEAKKMKSLTLQA